MLAAVRAVASSLRFAVCRLARALGRQPEALRGAGAPTPHSAVYPRHRRQLLVATALFCSACSVPERQFGAPGSDAGVTGATTNAGASAMTDAGVFASPDEDSETNTATSSSAETRTQDAGWSSRDASATTSGSAPDSSSDAASHGSTPCANRPCLNDGRCVEVGAGYLCDCPKGFIGDNCQINPDDCVDHACQNGAECIDGLAEYSCRCAAGYEGERCETDIDDCNPNPCVNGGICNDGVAQFSCTCVDDFGGPSCEVKLFELLGLLPNSSNSEATAISGNGLVVVGNSPDSDGDRAFIWKNGEMAALPSADQSVANSVNFDGNVVVGGIIESGTRRGAFWYEPFSSPIGLYSVDYRGNVARVINDASSTLQGVIVGSCTESEGYRACRWVNFDSDPSVLPVEDPFNYDTTTTVATDVSADGSVIVGYTQDPFRAFRWSEAEGWLTLQGIVESGAPWPPAPFASVITADGSVVFGTSKYDGHTDEYAVRWVGNSGQPEPLGFGRRVTATNADGSLIVIDDQYLWTQSEGPRSISDVLEGLGVDLTEWAVIRLTGISADGRAFSARAEGPAGGGGQAAIVRLP